jgi:hypothetical protein
MSQFIQFMEYEANPEYSNIARSIGYDMQCGPKDPYLYLNNECRRVTDDFMVQPGYCSLDDIQCARRQTRAMPYDSYANQFTQFGYDLYMITH